MEKGRTQIEYDGETYTYYFNKNGKACTEELNDGAVYNGKGVRLEAQDGNANQVYKISDVTSKRSDGTSRPMKLGNNKYYEDGSIIVSSTGMIRSGSVVIDDVKYEINSDYVIVKAYYRHDTDKRNLPSMYESPIKVTLDENGNVTKR